VVKNNDEQVKKILAEWEQYVHPRAMEFFPDTAAVTKVRGI
jgi:hypothetical protein